MGRRSVFKGRLMGRETCPVLSLLTSYASLQQIDSQTQLETGGWGTLNSYKLRKVSVQYLNDSLPIATVRHSLCSL